MINIPTLADLYNGIVADLEAEFGTTLPSWGKVVLRAQAAVQAAKLKIFYLYSGRLQKNIFVDTADPESAGGTLERFGRVKLGRNPYPATQGQYQVLVTGNIGAVIPANTTYKSDDTSNNPGMMYSLDNAYTFTGSSGTIILRALTAGADARLNINDTLTANAPIINVTSGAIVTSEILIANDAEDIEVYRAAAIASYRLYPQGGAPADYRIWGLEANGANQIYPYAASGSPNEINIFVEATVADSADGMGTPTSTILNDVASHIETDPATSIGRRPLGVFAVNVLPVIVNKIAITVTGSSSISSANQSLITLALSDAVIAVRPFIAGADVLADKNDSFGLNNIIAAILSTVPNAVFSSVSMTIQIGASTPVVTPSKSFDNGNIPFLTSVTYA